jgi:hypothetical protein
VSCHQLGPARREPLEDITKVVIIQVGWRLQQPQQPFGISWCPATMKLEGALPQ